MKTLKELLKEISEKEAESRISPEEADPRVRAGVEAMQKNALASLTPLKQEYKNSALSHAVIIAVSGAESKEFAEITSKKTKVLTLDYQLFKNKIVERLQERGAGGLYTQHAHLMLWDEMNKARLEYGFLRLPQPHASYIDGIFDQELSSSVATLFEKNYGSSLYSAVSRVEIGNLALSSQFSGDKFPVVLYNYTGSFDGNFLPAPVKTVEANDKVTERFVKQVLNEVRTIVNESKQEENIPTMGEQGE